MEYVICKDEGLSSMYIIWKNNPTCIGRSDCYLLTELMNLKAKCSQAAQQFYALNHYMYYTLPVVLYEKKKSSNNRTDKCAMNPRSYLISY